jgi:Rrf2 family protein
MTNSRLMVAVHVLTLLEHEGGGPLASEYIAGSVNTNPVVVRRMVSMLARAGLVSSSTGPGGGTRLAKDASRITLLDVYRAVEPGELFGEHPSNPNPKCPVGRHIQSALEVHFGHAERAMHTALDQITIASIVRSVTARASRHSA